MSHFFMDHSTDSPTLPAGSFFLAPGISSMRASVRPTIPCSSSITPSSISKEFAGSGQLEVAQQKAVFLRNDSTPSYVAKAQSCSNVRDNAAETARSNYALSGEFVDWYEAYLEREEGREFIDIQRGRDSMKELAEFLRTKEPPSNNWMSASCHDTSLLERKLPFKIFQRRSSTRSKDTSRPFKLPDSAVAAKTTSGHWHIAITIPKEYDLIDGRSRSNISQSERLPKTYPRSSRNSSARGLRPVIEEGGLSSTDASELLAVRSSASSNQRLGPLTQNNPKRRTESNLYIPDRPSKQGFVPVSTHKTSRSDSRLSDERHSGGTVYSAKTSDTYSNPSPEPSFNSTVPSLYQHISQHMGGRGPVPPKRSSSVLKKNSTPSPSTRSKSGRSLESGASKKQLSSSTSSNLAEVSHEMSNTPRYYEPTNRRSVSRNGPGTPGPAPTKRLPDLPEGREDGQIMRRRSPPGSVEIEEQSLPRIPSNVGLPKSSDFANLDEKEEFRAHTIARQERVKGIRARDMATLVDTVLTAKSKSLTEEPNTARLRSPNVSIPIPDAQGTRRAPNLSLPKPDRVRRKPKNSISCVMLVADLTPYREYTRDDWVDQPKAGRRTRNPKSLTISSSRNSITATHTSPRSPSPSFASSDDENIYSPRTVARISGAHSRSRSVIGDLRTPPPDRVAKTKPSLTSSKSSIGNLEGRLAKLEKANAALLQTLDAVVQVGASFKDLERLLPTVAERSLEVAPSNQGHPRAQTATNPESTVPLTKELQDTAIVSLETEQVGGAAHEYIVNVKDDGKL